MIKKLPRKATRLVARSIRQQAVVLLYHRITTLKCDPWSLAVSPEHFAEHLEVIRRYALPIPLRELARNIREGRAVKNRVAITFDDGYFDNLYHAKPLLERFDIPATAFVTTACLDAAGEFWWDELEALLLQPGTLASQPYREVWELLRIQPVDDREETLRQLRDVAGKPPASRPTHRRLSEAEVVRLAGGGLIEIGAHTVNHPSLAMLPLNRQRSEIEQSKHRLEEILQHPVTAFAYPLGRRDDYSKETRALVREAGFEVACSNIGGAVHRASDPYDLPRIFVEDISGEGLARKLAEFMYLAN